MTHLAAAVGAVVAAGATKRRDAFWNVRPKARQPSSSPGQFIYRPSRTRGLPASHGPIEEAVPATTGAVPEPGGAWKSGFGSDAIYGVPYCGPRLLCSAAADEARVTKSVRLAHVRPLALFRPSRALQLPLLSVAPLSLLPVPPARSFRFAAALSRHTSLCSYLSHFEDAND